MDDVTDGQIVGFCMVILYLVVFSFGASKFNKRMDKVNKLKRLLRMENVNKSKVEKDIKELKDKIQHYKGVIYSCFLGILGIHYLLPLFNYYYGFSYATPIIMFSFFVGLIIMFYSYEAKTVIPGKSINQRGGGLF